MFEDHGGEDGVIHTLVGLGDVQEDRSNFVGLSPGLVSEESNF